MALEDQVKSRYGGTSSQYLVNLTNNFDSDGAGTVDDAVLGLACDDVKADIEMQAGVVYDDSAVTNPEFYRNHIAVAVQCVIVKLQLNTGKAPDKVAIALTRRYDTLLKHLAQITGRDRFLVQSSSPYEESDQTAPNGDPILPPFDDDLMQWFIPEAGTGPGNRPDNKINLW